MHFRLLIPLPIQIPQIDHPELLPIAESRIARITAVIHKIMHRILPLAVGTTVLRIPLQRRASIRAHALLRRIIHVIPLIGRIAAFVLESV